MVRVMNGEMMLRPIAGTRPRGETPAEDQALADELIKENDFVRAEEILDMSMEKMPIESYG